MNRTQPDPRHGGPPHLDEPNPGPSLSRLFACNVFSALLTIGGWLVIGDLFGVNTTSALFGALYAGLVRLGCIELLSSSR